MVTTLKDLVGKRFGRLVVISRAANKSGQTQWLCLCDCGSTKIIQGSSLTSGLTRSCMCLRREIKNLLTWQGKRMQE